MARKTDRTQTAADVCAELGISRSALQDYESKGCPCTRPGRGKPNHYNVTEIAAWMRANDLTGKVGRPVTKQSKNQQDADLRKTNAMADNWEIRNARELGELLPAADVARAWSRVAHEVRSRVLNAAPAVAPGLDGMNVTERTAEIDRALREALEGLDPATEPTAGEQTRRGGGVIPAAVEAAGEDQAE